MRSARSTPRALARLDLRLALLLAFTSLLLCGLLAYALVEALEEQAVILDDAIAAVAAATSEHDVAAPVAVHQGIAYRVTDAHGAVIARDGDWAADAPVHVVSREVMKQTVGFDLHRAEPGRLAEEHGSLSRLEVPEAEDPPAGPRGAGWIAAPRGRGRIDLGGPC